MNWGLVWCSTNWKCPFSIPVREDVLLMLHVLKGFDVVLELAAWGETCLLAALQVFPAG